MRIELYGQRVIAVEPFKILARAVNQLNVKPIIKLLHSVDTFSATDIQYF
jgi:hypothetical protein